MAEQNQNASSSGPNGAAGAFDSAVNAMNATSKSMQAIAGEMLEISKQSFEHTTQTMEKLRNAHSIDEVVAIQTNFVKEALEHAAQHAQKFSQLITTFPAEITKTYQDAWLKSMNSTVKATETARQTAAENIGRFAEAAKKSSTAFDHRESA